MDILLSLLLFITGTAILLKGADWLVTGASSVAASLKINPIVVGLTVVAFGTSSPELVVSVNSALSGNTDIALGNIIGSNIANIMLILGAAAVITPIRVYKSTSWKEIPMSFLGAVLLCVLALQDQIDKGALTQIDFQGSEIVGYVTASNGLVLLSFFIIFLYYSYGVAKQNHDEPELESKSLSNTLVLLLIGIIGLTLGSKLLVDNGVMIARYLGVSDVFIGLTLIAIGTSLPELITSLVAAWKKQVGIAVGNVVGSNIFNIFLVLGITSIIKPVPMMEQTLQDVGVLFVATALLFGSLFVMKKHMLSRFEGMTMLLFYGVYIAFLIYRG